MTRADHRNIAPFFSDTYVAARAGFLEAATSAGAEITSFRHNRRGRHKEVLAVDVARIGDRTAEKIVLTVSGTHGVEGYLGSAVQTGELARPCKPSDGQAIVHVHAVNPFGMSWCRRVNEDNVDLNRNFIDHGASPAANEAYDELHELLCPRVWNETVRRETGRALRDFLETRGSKAFLAAIADSQETHPDGLFFAGRGPAWSRRVFQRILDEICGLSKEIFLVDLHTGLGERGRAEVTSMNEPESTELGNVRRCFGDEVTCFRAGEAGAPAYRGLLALTAPDLLPGKTVSSVVIEYGTEQLLHMLDLLRADNWLHNHGNPLSAEGDEIRRAMRDGFCPRDPGWRTTVWSHGIDAIDRALSTGG